MRTGGQLVVDALRAHGVDTLFCVPGESYLEVLDALVDAPSIRVVVCRHEAGAANMAEAYGKLTGRPGICFVTRGPGAAHAAIGCHIARQDSTPMILFVGQVERGASDREAFQEVDLRSMFASLSKWAGQIEDPRRIPELVSRAFHLAVSGRPGPVVLGLPEDMLVERARAAAVGPYRVVRPSPSGDDMTTLRAMLEKAQRPFMILGGGGWDDQACVDIRAFAEANVVPVGCAFRRQDRRPRLCRRPAQGSGRRGPGVRSQGGEGLTLFRPSPTSTPVRNLIIPSLRAWRYARCGGSGAVM